MWWIIIILGVLLFVIAAVRYNRYRDWRRDQLNDPAYGWYNSTCIEPGHGKGKNRVEPKYVDIPLSECYTPEQIAEAQKCGRWMPINRPGDGEF